MKHQPHALLRPTDQHQEMLDGTGILLQPHVDQIVRKWNTAFQKLDPTLKPAQLRKLERIYEIMKRIVDGYKNREIAEILKICVKTVEHHRASLMQKLGVSNAIELTKFAIRNRLA